MFDGLGKVICHAESKISTIQNGDLIVEHDPQEMIESVFNVLDEVSNILGEKFNHVVDAGIATQRSSFVCWDKKTGRALTPIISWQDRRTVNEIDRYEYANELIHETTGLYLNPHYGATKIRWCLDNVDGLLEQQELNNLCIAPLASFIMFHLLEGAPFKIDPANASRTLLMNNKTLMWDEKLLLIFEIPKKFLPEIADTKMEYGIISYKNHAFPLSVCTGDQSAAIFFRGEPDKKSLFINIGTGAFVQQYCDGLPPLGKEKLLASVVYSNKNEKTYVLEGTINGAARALDWLSDQEGDVDYVNYLDEWSESIDEPPIFLNGISGVGSPFWISNFNSRFLSESSVNEKFVGVLESIVFLIYTNILSTRKIGDKVEYIYISGGLSKSNAICQKLSDLSQLSIVRDLDVEATALGVYFLLAGASEEVSNLESDEFFPSKNKLLLERYEIWLKEMRSNQGK